ncbi:polysaccharide biosynthesis protein [Fibrobacter sp. UWB5]|nr:polysaccharide biosynthesis protein [Fibrobacter sp. UWB5]
MNSSNKTIARNTIFLYFRMMLTMIISLYTSRVVLQILGVDDYGIYQAVGGIVGFLSFVNNALSTGSSRFITFGLGENDPQKLKNIFSTTLTAHLCLAIFIAILAESAGLWFLHNKLVIAPERLDAAKFVLHLSVITAFFSLTQVPYGASIIAHEKMGIYAYVSIIEASLKLLIIYLLEIGSIDKLKLYALLLCLLQIGIIIFYRLYCIRNFDETKFRFYFDKKLFKEIASFSGWSLFANTAIALNNQGVLVLLNMFFSPAVVAARAISLQVNAAANQFVTNFQTAANPQIVKKYAAKDYEGSKQLLLATTKFSFYLMLLLSLPICLGTKQLLTLWLKTVPEYTIIFLQLAIIQSLFCVFDTSFYRALYAKGRLKENALISPLLGFIQFPIVYILFRLGFSPEALSWTSLFTYAFLGLVIKPLLIIKIVNYKWKDISSVFVPCFKVLCCALPAPLFLYYKLSDESYLSFFAVVILSVLSVITSSWFVGLETEMRNALKNKVKALLLKRSHP